MPLPCSLPEVTVFQPAYHAELRVLLPAYVVLPAPCSDSEVAGIGKAVAGFLVGMQLAKGSFLPDATQYIGQFTCVDFKAAALQAQRVIKGLQRFADKLKVLQGCIRLPP